MQVIAQIIFTQIMVLRLFYTVVLKPDILKNILFGRFLHIISVDAFALTLPHHNVSRIRKRNIAASLQIEKLRPRINIYKIIRPATHILNQNIFITLGRILSHRRLYPSCTLILLIMIFLLCTDSEPHVRQP